MIALFCALLGVAFILGALFEHLRRGGTADLRERLVDRDYLAQVMAALDGRAEMRW